MRRWLVLFALAWPGVARAGFDPDSLRGGALLHYDVTYVDQRLLADRGDAPPAADRGLTLAGFRLRGFLSRGFPLGYLIGLDVHAGSTNPRGFAYQADLYLVGTGARLGKVGMLGVGSGVGVSGAVGTLDDAVELPLDAFFELGLGSHLRVLARAHCAWLGAAPGRDGGAPGFGWTDEVEASFALRVGDRYRDFGFPTGNGYFVGVAYREAEGARFVGATIGYAVDLGTR